ncbi:MAG: tRNA (adenosine(37)-N6)-threonylcarbamoyltransferase complex dimerization subunit type 1 TsaB [Bacteroidetes bacterium GWF2_33_16]|nr:MAG: tRNA (adenosine(37)-N6)-threonylcarbamoyltransferase complex dimerization subunit type 1 TsaB [Bacteroidetes bacterium GWE2_32_14]OFY04766.1 MAG: tRNA (adenosine(37)-N6)-threonylcarbamoyltransferase complex dimerization subunit type 1 TsaB [Bacteroidetes bacterium GWF2_33_16]
MALILTIETSTRVCSVALSDNGKIISKKESNDEKSHAKLLTLFIDDVLKESSVNYNQLDAIAVSKGPGSYTGLRIGVSVAKGLCYALDKPLIAINTLQLMCFGVIRRVSLGDLQLDGFSDAILVPMIDARRMEVYTALYNSKAEKIRDVTAEIITENSFYELLKIKKLICFGDGAQKAKEVIEHSNLIYIADVTPLAIDMVTLSDIAFSQQHFENTAYFEPFYLKDFVATIPKKNIFS